MLLLASLIAKLSSGVGQASTSRTQSLLCCVDLGKSQQLGNWDQLLNPHYLQLSSRLDGAGWSTLSPFGDHVSRTHLSPFVSAKSLLHV